LYLLSNNVCGFKVHETVNMQSCKVKFTRINICLYSSQLQQVIQNINIDIQKDRMME